MPAYLAHYAFKYPESSLRPDDQMYGIGTVAIETDKEPTTAEEFKEICRTIGMDKGYAQVAITEIEPTEEFVDDAVVVMDGLFAND